MALGYKKYGNEETRTYYLGKINCLNVDRKSNTVELKVCLTEREKNGKSYKEFSASANVWNHIHTDIYMGGQCLDELTSYFKGNEVFDFVYDMWQKYHLNGMNAGTIEQEKALKEAVARGELSSYGANNYKESCDYLKSVGLYEVEVDGQPYKYGTGWLVREIPEEDLKRISYFIENGELMEENEIERD